MPQGIILAAGTSSRAKTNKMLWRHRGLFLIEYAINGMMPFVSQIFVVTGHYHYDIAAAIKERPNVTLVYNKDYMLGMFSSVLAGAARVSDDCFILPGDCPFVKPETYMKILSGSHDVRVPECRGIRGHPLFISRRLMKSLVQEPIMSNLKAFRNNFEAERIEVDDGNILTDLDEIEDLQELEERINQ